MDPNSPNFVEQLYQFLDLNPEVEEELFGESEAELPDDESNEELSPEENGFEEEDDE